MSDEKESTPNKSVRWKNRRRMAWLSLWGAVLYPLLVLFSDADLIAGIAPHYYLFAAAVVGAYMGFSTWDDRGR